MAYKPASDWRSGLWDAASSNPIHVNFGGGTGSKPLSYFDTSFLHMYIFPVNWKNKNRLLITVSTSILV